MAFSELIADTMRADIGVEPGITEKKMFGGLAFMLHGNMVCGVTKDGGMYRVGKASEQDALDLGALQLSFTGRKMGGMVELDADGFENDTLRQKLTELSLAHASSLPPKG